MRALLTRLIAAAGWLVLIVSSPPTTAAQDQQSRGVAAVDSVSVVLAVNGLGWGAVQGLGWGSKLAPVLARIEKLKGVLDAWTDKSGTRLVVSFESKASSEDAIALVSSALAPSHGVKEIRGTDAEAAVRECQSGAPGWFRAREARELSKEEARIVAARAAKRAAEQAGLDAEKASRFEALVRDALVRIFGEQEKRDALDMRALNERCHAELERIAKELDLPAEQAAKLKDALEQSWRAAARPGDKKKRWF